MGGGKKKKDPAKELAKKQRKAAKQERCAAKREGKLAGPDEEVDLLALIAAQRLKDAARTEVTVAKLEPPTDGAFAPFRPRCNASLAAVGDDLYLFGGELNEGDQTTVFNDLYRYRTAKDEWYAVASLNAPSPRCAHQAVALGKHVYVFGGEYATLTQFYHYRDLWRLDTRTHAWELVEPAKKKGPSARSGHRCCEWRGKILLFGGFFKASSEVEATFMNDAWLYSPSDNEWRELKFSKRPGVAKPPVRSGGVLFASTEDHATIWGGYSEIKCDNAVKAQGKEHGDCWKLTIGDPFAGDATPERAHVFGGVHDVDGDGLSSTSLFYDDLHVLDLGKRKWKRPRGLGAEAGAAAAAPWDVAALASALAVPPPAPPRHKAADAAAPPKPAPAPTAPPPRDRRVRAIVNKVLVARRARGRRPRARPRRLLEPGHAEEGRGLGVPPARHDAPRSAAWKVEAPDSDSDSDSGTPAPSTTTTTASSTRADDRRAEPDEEKKADDGDGQSVARSRRAAAPPR
ncbi:galactose oxidase [Aureococcus anophagefferens]|nr:galactose oxidase [Aureococcus anophagefferens]